MALIRNKGNVQLRANNARAINARSSDTSITPGTTTTPSGDPNNPGHVNVADDSGHSTTVAVPANLIGEFPEATYANFDPIEAAKYNFVNPLQFSKKYSPYIRNEVQKNFQMAQGMGLQQLDTELKGLQNYTPAAAALKRSQLSIDNQFNQFMRTQQVNETMPNLAGDLAAQRTRANAYASGRLPSEQDDRALELGIRSNAADRAAAGGFGAKSLAGQKASTLMSEEERLKIAQYGEQLLGSNIGTTASMYLAPTQYSTAGSEIKVMPEVGAGRAAASYAGELDQATIVPTTTALTNVINQEQFKTNLEQRTKEYNASNAFQESIDNASIANSFAMDKFQYKTGYAAAVAGAENAAADRNFQLLEQEIAKGVYDDAKNQTQNANTIRDTAAALTSAGTFISALSGIGGGSNTSGTSSTGTSGATGTAAAPSSTEGGTAENPAPSPNAPAPTEGGAETAPAPTSDQGTSGSEGVSGNAPSVDTGGVSGTDTTGVDQNTQAQILSEPELSALDNNSRQGAAQTGAAITGLAGFTTDQRGNSQVAFVDNNGKTVYVDRSAAQNTDIGTGARFVNGMKGALDPMGGLSQDQTNALAAIGSVSSDAEFMLQVDDAMNKGDQKGAVDLILQKFGRPMLDNMATKQDAYDRGNAALTAANVLLNWGHMNAAQKSISLAGLGLAVDKSLGGNLMNTTIPKTNIAGTGKGLTYGQALNVMSAGINVYSLIDNWDQLNDAQRVIYGTNTAVSVVQVAKDLGLVGKASQGVASAADMVKLGYGASPALGVKAYVAEEGTRIPTGYVKTGTVDGMQVVVPKGNESTSIGAVSPSSGKLPTARAPIANNPATGQTAIDPTTGERVPADANGNPISAPSETPGATPTGETTPGTAQTPASETPIEPDYLGGTALTAGGAAQIYAGYKEYQQGGTGNKVSGAAGVAAGGYTVASGAAKLAGDAESSASFGRVAGYIGLAKSAFDLYRNWGEGPPDRSKRVTTAAVKGAEAGGYGFMAGMGWYSLIPAAVAFGGTLVRTGKNEDQKYRDSVREDLKTNGILDENYNLTTANGQKIYMGDDGHSGEHDPRYPDKFKDNPYYQGKLHSYDVDYSNDLDYLMGSSGISLSRLLVGGKNDAVDKIGGQIGNGITRDTVGYGKDLTQDTFNKAITNMRAAYANAGVTSKADAYQMANVAYSEGRINETDLLAMHKTYDMVFDKDGFADATSLLKNRWPATSASQEKAQDVDRDVAAGKIDKSTTVRTGADPARYESRIKLTQPANFKTNTTSSVSSGAFQGTPEQMTRKSTLRPITIPGIEAAPGRRTKSTLALSKETIRDLNRRRYGMGAVQ